MTTHRHSPGRRREWIAVAAVITAACGPERGTVASSEDGGSTSSDVTATTTATAGTDSTPGADTTGGASDDGASSSGAEAPPEFLGDWLCQGYDTPIYLVVDAYEGSNHPTGRACLADGDVRPPPDWTRCAVLSPHPLDVPFWVLLDFGDELALNLQLVHDLVLDELDGSFTPGLEQPAHCVRYVE